MGLVQGYRGCLGQSQDKSAETDYKAQSAPLVKISLGRNIIFKINNAFRKVLVCLLYFRSSTSTSWRMGSGGKYWLRSISSVYTHTSTYIWIAHNVCVRTRKVILSPQNYHAVMTIYTHQHLLSWQFETSLNFFCIPTIFNKLRSIQSKKQMHLMYLWLHLCMFTLSDTICDEQLSSVFPLSGLMSAQTRIFCFSWHKCACVQTPVIFPWFSYQTWPSYLSP